MSETLGMIHSEAKFHSIFGVVEVEKKLSVPKAQAYDKSYRYSYSKREKTEGEKRVGYSPWSFKESNTTEQLTLSPLFLSNDVNL